jgi:hypothetical protein
MEAVLNIGLNNNPKSPEGILEVIEALFSFTELSEHRIEMGEFNGNPENTLIVELDSRLNAEWMRINIEILCEQLTQESIAVKFNGKGELVFNPAYKGERYEFNEDYFLNI